MTTTTNVSQVKLNIMTQEQYDNAIINENEFYLIPNSETIRGIAVIPVGTVFQAVWADESKDLVRQLNGQTISSSKFSGFRSWLDEVQTNYPSLFTTEVNWQAEVTNSVLGQCGKFVIDDENQTIRLPKVINAQGLSDLQYLGTLKNESLPNITGSSAMGYLGSGGKYIAMVRDTSSGALYGGGISGDYVPASSSTTVSGSLHMSLLLDASRSSSTYQTDAPVQQEAIQYPYYIQVATGVEETLPAIREYKVNNSDFFGKSMYSDVPPDNASWLVSNGSYNAKTLYPDYYDWLVSHIGETITANGGKVVLSTDAITDYDFVVNQSNQTFRLPLLDGSENLPSDRFDEVTLQASDSSYTAPANGWIYLQKMSTASSQSVAINVRDANNHSYYGNRIYSSASGQYLAIEMFLKRGETYYTNYSSDSTTGLYFRFMYAKGNGTLYYYVGDTIQDASLINAGAVLGQLANKANIDASNFNADGKSLLSGLGMPSSRVVALTLGASGTDYIAPANGYVYLQGTSTASGQFVRLYPRDKDNTTNLGNIACYATASGQYPAVILPVKKGNYFRAGYDTGGSSKFFNFIYAEGEE